MTSCNRRPVDDRIWYICILYPNLAIFDFNFATFNLYWATLNHGLAILDPHWANLNRNLAILDPNLTILEPSF